MCDVSKVFIKDIKERDEISTVFLVSHKRLGISKSAKPYMDITLQDKTGSIPAKIWVNADFIDTLIKRNDYVLVNGVIESYNGTLQIRVENIEKVEYEVKREDYIPYSKYSSDEMKERLRFILRSIENPFLLKLIGSLWNDSEFMEKFSIWPGAVKMHHAYGAGLLEHTLSVVENCSFFIGKYKNSGVRGDLLLAAAFLHDIGKIEEMSFELSTEYTEEGQLLGHIVLGIKMIQKKVCNIEGFPKELLTELEHLLISHHGELGYGSPKVPMNIDAFLLSFADDIDAKVNMLASVYEQGSKKGDSFVYTKPLERYIEVVR